MQISDLYNIIYETEETKEPKRFVEVYEKHREIIEKQHLNGEEVYFQASRLRSDYAICLSRIEQWSKALPEINIALGLFEQNPKYSNTNLFEIEFYTHLKFHRAVCNYSLKNFKAALKDLNELHKQFPENDKYNNWLKETKFNLQFNFENIFGYLMLGALVIKFLNNPRNEDLNIIVNYIFGIAGILFIISKLAKWWIRKRVSA